MTTIALDASSVKTEADVEGTQSAFVLESDKPRRKRRERKVRPRAQNPAKPDLSGFTADQFVDLLGRLSGVRGKAQQLFYYLYKLALTYDDSYVYPSNDAIVDESGVAERTADTGLAELQERGVTRHEDVDGLRHIHLNLFQNRRPSSWSKPPESPQAGTPQAPPLGPKSAPASAANGARFSIRIQFKAKRRH